MNSKPVSPLRKKLYMVSAELDGIAITLHAAARKNNRNKNVECKVAKTCEAIRSSDI